jgi:RNA polymerase sigma-70 factor (ECF subfamily)
MRVPVTPPEDWSALMSRIQGGDRLAYEALVRSVTPYLRYLAYRGLRDTGDVEEVVQEVLLAIHQNGHAYEPGRPFAPWVTAIARRRIVDRVRQNRRYSRCKETMAEAMLTQPQADFRQIEPDEFARLYSAINALPKGQREAILLLKLRQMSLNEAAMMTGLSVGALKVSVHRGSKRLRGSLAEGGGHL